MASLTVQINSYDTDAQENGGTMTLDGAALNANGTAQYIGLIFYDVEDLDGATIDEAHLELYFTSGSFDDPDVSIYANDVDSCPTVFTTSASMISSMTATTAAVAWDAGSVGTGWENSPDIKTVIQEIIDRPGWNGQRFCVILKGATADSLCRIRSYDGEPTEAAKLVVTYTVAGTEYTQDVAGTLTSSGVIVRMPGKALGGTLTTAGAVVRAVTKSMAGTLTTAGNVARLTAKSAAGTLTSAGAAALTAGKALAGSLSSAGILARETFKPLAGTLTTAGAVSSIRLFVMALAGTLTSAGNVARMTAHAFDGTLTSAGSLARTTRKELDGVLATAGDLVKGLLAYVSLAGTLGLAGSVAKATTKSAAGALDMAGSVARSTSLTLAGAVSSAGDVARSTGKVLAGALTSAGSVARLTSRTLAGVLSSAGGVVSVYIPGGIVTGIRDLTAKARAFALTFKGRP